MNEEIQAELGGLRGSELSETTAEIAMISAPRSTSSSAYGEAVHHVAFWAHMLPRPQNTELRLRPRTSRFMP
jgi:hypothetical protein